MKEKINEEMLLSQDEEGHLMGGFSLQEGKVPDSFGADNGNCKGGGWFDSNTNCNECDACRSFTSDD